MRNRNRKGVSAVLGMLLVLAVVASAITVIAVYRLPVLEKRVEFSHEAKLLDDFFNLRKAYLTNYSETLELSPANYLLTTHEDSCLSVFTFGKEVLRYVSTSSGTHTVYGRIPGFNISIYPSRLPYVHASLTPEKAVIYQNGYSLTLLNDSEQFYGSVFSVSGNNVVAVVYNFTVNGKNLSNFTVSGNGVGFISVFKHCRTVQIDNVTDVRLEITSASGSFVRNLSGRYNLSIVFCNYSVYIS